MERPSQEHKVSQISLSLSHTNTHTFSWIHYKTVHVNNSWMSTVDQSGYGNITEEDFVRLIESKGFRVDEAKTIPLEYKLDKDFVKNFFKQTIMTSFPDLVGEKRKEFFSEYIPRVRELSTFVSRLFLFCFSLTHPFNLNFRIQTGTMTPMSMGFRYLERK